MMSESNNNNNNVSVVVSNNNNNNGPGRSTGNNSVVTIQRLQRAAWDKHYNRVMQETSNAFNDDVNGRDHKGRTALHFAVKTRWQRRRNMQQYARDYDDIAVNIIEMLVSNGADINAQDINGCTALHYASWGFYERAHEKLIELGANVDVKNDKNEDGSYGEKSTYDRRNIYV
jgi:ankyrin repeat protein